jgi:hypothetical protein
MELAINIDYSRIGTRCQLPLFAFDILEPGSTSRA